MKPNESDSDRPRRWALVAWPKEAGAGYLLLPGRYETMAGAILASDVAAMKHKRTMQIVEVAGAGPDEQSGVIEQEPPKAVREQRMGRRREQPPMRMWLVVEPVLEVPELQAWCPVSLHDDEREAKHRLGGGRKAVRAFVDFHVPKWESPTDAEVSERGPLASKNTTGETRDSLH
jgi:hypothetical protein